MDTQTAIFEITKLNSSEDVYVRLNHSHGDYITYHWHDSIEILYLKKGDLTVTLTEKEYSLAENSFILINARDIHSTQCANSNDALVLHLPYEYLKSNFSDMDNMIFDLSLESECFCSQDKILKMNQILSEIYTLHEENPKWIQVKFNSLIHNLLYYLYRYFSKDKPVANFQKQSKRFSILKRVMSYSEECHEKNITIKEISDLVGLQPNYFCRFFKQNIGCTYLNYLNELRISYIYKDLTSTDLPIYVILEKHGFTNQKLFRKMFFNQFQDTPNHIRKQNSGSYKRKRLYNEFF